MALLKFGGCLAKDCGHLALSRRFPDKATERVAAVDSKASGWRDLVADPNLPDTRRLSHTRLGAFESLKSQRYRRDIVTLAQSALSEAIAR